MSVKMLNPFEDKYWVPRGSNKLLTYLGPPLTSNLDQKELKRFLAKRSAYGAIWYYDDDYTDKGPWYRTACDQSDYDIELIKSKNSRKKIRNCFRQCQIRLMDLADMLESIYDVYLQATKRYKNPDIISKDEFKTDLLNKLKTHVLKTFGVFYEEKLIAYSIVIDFNDYAMGYLAAFDPGYSKCFPMYGLCYFVPKYFVSDRGYKEFNRGTKPLLHDTNFDAFLQNLGYRKKYCRLGVFFVSPIDFTISLLNRISLVIKYLMPKRFRLIVEALIQAKKIADQTMKPTAE